MFCNYCGYALDKNKAVCPHCKRMLTPEQLKERKEMNGVNNPYMERLEKLNYEKIKNKLFTSGNNISIKPYVVIIGILLLIIVLAFII